MAIRSEQVELNHYIGAWIITKYTCQNSCCSKTFSKRASNRVAIWNESLPCFLLRTNFKFSKWRLVFRQIAVKAPILGNYLLQNNLCNESYTSGAVDFAAEVMYSLLLNPSLMLGVVGTSWRPANGHVFLLGTVGRLSGYCTFSQVIVTHMKIGYP